MVNRQLALVVGAALLAPTLALAQRERESHAVAGRVTGSQKEVVSHAEVWLVERDEVVQSARTDSAGRFAFRGLNRGQYDLRVRRLGYQPRNLPARLTQDAEAPPQEIVLQPMPAELDKVLVVGRLNDTRGRLREFYEHREKAKFGTFFDRDQIQQKQPRYLSDLMRFVPGARLVPGRIGSVVRIRGCRPLLWIDGVRVPGAELDETVSMADIEAVEVYNSFAGIPAQYVDRNTNCGAIVVWMKG